MILPIIGAGESPWYHWSWSAPQAPVEYFFRRHENVLVKSPSGNSECQCPPHKECVVEFKMNEDMVHFLKMRGLIKDDDVRSYQEDIEDYRKSHGLSPKEYIRENRYRRSNPDDDPCCCQPRSVMMPTFITDKKFDEVVDRFSFDKKQVPPIVRIRL